MKEKIQEIRKRLDEASTPLDVERWENADLEERTQMLYRFWNYPSVDTKRPGEIRWERDGGHPDRMLDKWRERLEDAGFEPVDNFSGGVPDGSRMDKGSKWEDPLGNKATISKSYGRVAADNWFYVTINIPRP